jgi:hypothetical protein
MIAEAKVPEPKTGDCWTSYADDVWDIIEVPAATAATTCGVEHIVETVHVGHFTGALADSDRAPTLEQMGEAYTACETEITTFLGASWQLGRTRMLVYAPTNTQWHGGARFYRCDIASVRNLRGVMEQRTASLQGTLQADGDRLLGCGVRATADGPWTDMTPAACTAPHDMEFLGLIPSKTAPMPTGTDAVKAAFGDGCLNQLRAYTHSSDNTLYKAKLRYGYNRVASGANEWTVGNHNAHCFVLLPKKITRSLKNNGNAAI